MVLKSLAIASLIRKIFFGIDKIFYNWISEIYNLLVTIARVSPLSQADIVDMSDRIYRLLAIFMIFKVTFSLIMYVVNPDDFSDKSKGWGKLTSNIIISLALLILTPYIFNMAYRLQAIILEDNSLAALIFGEDGDKGFFNTAGDQMAFIAMSPFMSPDISQFPACSILTQYENGELIFNEQCSGLSNENLTELSGKDIEETLFYQTSNGASKNSGFELKTLQNYVEGVRNKNMGMAFREDIITATNSSKDEFIMDYSYFFSTAVAILIILLLISFCLDIATRSMKLAFFQLIAPIPIISFVDPKSGKDGMFKKWYKACFSTYLSLFIRLLSIYFAVYIISKLQNLLLYDAIDQTFITSKIAVLFIMIGALMFAKQLPKILENLGIKLDGGGKFTLNPLRKIENEAVGGKRITGALGGMRAAFSGNTGARKLTSLAGGALRGFGSNGGYRGGVEAQAGFNRKMRELRINGVKPGLAFIEGRASRYGGDDMYLEREATHLRKFKDQYDDQMKIHEQERVKLNLEKQQYEAALAPMKRKAERYKKVQSTSKAMLDYAKDNITKNKAGIEDNLATTAFGERTSVSQAYSKLNNKVEVGTKNDSANDIVYTTYDAVSGFGTVTLKPGEVLNQNQAQRINDSAGAYLAKSKGAELYFNDLLIGGKEVEFDSLKSEYKKSVGVAGEVEKLNYSDIKTQKDEMDSKAVKVVSDKDYVDKEKKIADIEDDIKQIDEQDVTINGEKMTAAKAKSEIDRMQKELDEKKKARANSREFGTHFGHFRGPGGKK